jgi:hypothetical protein
MGDSVVMNMHIEEYLAHEKLAEARARAATELLLQAADPGRPGLRVALGLALIRVGRWLAGPTPRTARQATRTA